MTNQVPLSRDELSQRLRSKMRTDRFRYYRSLAVLALLPLLVIAAIVWWFYPRGAIPTLAVVAFDSVALPGAKAHWRAQIEATEGEPVPGFLGELKVVFVEARSLAHPQDQLQSVTANAQGNGHAETSLLLKAFDRAGEAKYLVRLLGNRPQFISEDPARVHFLAADTPLVLVDVGQLLAEPGVEVWSGSLAAIQPHPEAVLALQALKGKHQPVYLALDKSRALDYRQQRRWLESRQAQLPQGPVLGRTSFHEGESEQMARRKIVAELARQYSLTAFAGDRSTAALLRDLKIDTILVGPEDPPEGTRRAASWKDVPLLLK